MTTVRKSLRVVTESEGSPYPKASLLLRAGGRLVDLVVAITLYFSTGPAGVVVALLYLLFADGMLQGQSLGKRLFGVKVVYLPTGQGARHRDSVLRNSPFGLVIVLGMMPDLGLRAFVAGCVVVGAIEIVKVLRDPLGLRLGDLWANGEPPWQHVLARPEARLHLYGKLTPAPGRKMGHVVLLDDDTDRALRTAEELVAKLAT